MSIQDTVNAAHRIRESAKDLQQRTVVTAEVLQRSGMRLSGAVRGSRTGEQAVAQEVGAEHAVRECAARLLTLQSDIDRFIQDLIK